MLQLGAKFISYLLHPLLMPTWLFGILLCFSPSLIQGKQLGVYILVLIFGMTFFLPLLNLFFFKMTGTIQSFHLPTSRERVLPFILITLVYAAITLMFYWKMPVVPIYFKLMIIATMLSAAVTILNFFFKISAHAVGMSGLVGILLAMAQLASISELIFPSVVVVVLAGATMSSRLLLNAHDLREVGWGGAVGLGVGIGGVVGLF